LRKSDLLDAVFHADLAAFKPRRLSWRNAAKQADRRDTRDCIDASLIEDLFLAAG
jgi:hypothetical protein